MPVGYMELWVCGFNSHEKAKPKINKKIKAVNTI